MPFFVFFYLLFLSFSFFFLFSSFFLTSFLVFCFFVSSKFSSFLSFSFFPSLFFFFCLLTLGVNLELLQKFSLTVTYERHRVKSIRGCFFLFFILILFFLFSIFLFSSWCLFSVVPSSFPLWITVYSPAAHMYTLTWATAMRGRRRPKPPSRGRWASSGAALLPEQKNTFQVFFLLINEGCQHYHKLYTFQETAISENSPCFLFVIKLEGDIFLFFLFRQQTT